jgi:RNA polymerase-binding transcription factor DksA
MNEQEIEMLKKKIQDQQEFIEEGLDRNDRFDKAESQWYERHLKDQKEIEKMKKALAWADEELSRLKSGKESQLVDHIKALEAQVYGVCPTCGKAANNSPVCSNSFHYKVPQINL